MTQKSDLVIDVGSGSIGACLMHSSGNAVSLSLVKRVPIGSGSHTSRENITGLAQGALKTLLPEFKTALIHNARVVLASPWYSSKISTIATQSEKPIRISHATVTHAIEGYRAKQDKGGKSAARSHVESVVTQMSVNGYATTLKKTVIGSSLKIMLYESEADNAFLKALSDSVHGMFPHARISFHSFPLLVFIILRDMRDEQSFVFIDAGGEITDVGVVFRDSLAFLGSFPRGSAGLMRDLSDPQKGLADATSRLALFVREELSAEEQAAFGPVFAKASNVWGGELAKMLESARAGIPIPQTTFVIADREEVRWFARIFADNPDAFPARPVFLTPDFFQNSVTLGNDAIYDACMSLEALFFHTIHSEKTKNLVEV